MTKREEIVGRKLFNVFPDNPDDPAASGVRNLRASLDRVLQNRVSDSMPLQKYDIRRPEEEGGGFEERFWSPFNSPVLDGEGKISYIIHRVEDVTEFVELKRRGSEQAKATEELRVRAERMESDIYLRSQEVAHANEHLRCANAELARLNREIVAKNEQLEQANRTKADFLSTMSHELRTPLNAIIGFSDILQNEPSNLSAEQREFAGHIYASGQHLLHLINDILDLSKIEAGKFEISLEPVDLQTTLADTLMIVRGSAAAKHVSLEYRASLQRHHMLADPRRLKQIVYNLLANAVKFTPEGGRVTLEARIVDRKQASSGMPGFSSGIRMPLPESAFEEFVQVSASDTGIGITPENLARLFTPFTQVGNPKSGNASGTGLGLAMVRRLAEMHRGTVCLTSEPSRGSCFTVWLPWRAPSPTPSALVPTHPTMPVVVPRD
jgi:signal transduction histidine kinase